MNPITKVLKQQAQITKSSVSTPEVVARMLETPQLAAIIDPYLQTCRKRLYGPVETLSMFISQALSTDRSCQNAVNQAALYDEYRSVATGGYCRARQRLDTAMMMQLTQGIARHNETEVSASWRWRGRDVYLVDGTTLIMPDTPANQQRYPQTSALPQRIGFPICRLVGIVSLATGSLIDAAVSPFRGKGACEQTLLRSLLHRFKPGDVVLADAYYSTSFLIAHMLAHDIDIVFVQHGARTRTTDFSKGVQLGKNDHLITLVKPKQKPELR